MIESFDLLVAGGGFYGCVIAAYFAKKKGFNKILLAESGPALMRRASYNNQARIHNGYHYPRSFTTAYRSRINFPRFLSDWPAAAKTDFTKIYAIARNNSKVTARQFQRFCDGIGARLDPVDSSVRSLFEPRLIEDMFLVQEHAFDATKLAAWAMEELERADIEIHYQTTVESFQRGDKSNTNVDLRPQGGDAFRISARYVFNCTYSGLDRITGEFPGIDAVLKHELTEMALVKPPVELANMGVTVMDGPFFSLMPFPPRGLHTLSHVRYTPHFSWFETAGVDPHEVLRSYPRASRFDRMMRDVRRYIPAVGQSVQIDSLFEIKTVLVKNESDDGRPIFFQKHAELPGCYSILGGKIDNVYDVIEKLDEIFE